MRVKLVNRYGEVLILPEELSLKGWPDDTNLKGTEIEGRPGRIIDRPNSKLRPRIIRVAGYMAGIDKDDADKIREMIAGFVNEAGPFKIYRHDTADKYMYVYKKSMDHEYRTGHFEGKVFSLSLSFEAADPLFYSDEVTEEFYVTGDSVRVSAVNPNLPGTNGLVDVEYVGRWDFSGERARTQQVDGGMIIKFYGTGLILDAYGSLNNKINVQIDNEAPFMLTFDKLLQDYTSYALSSELEAGVHVAKIVLAQGTLATRHFDILGSNQYLLENPGTAESEPVIYVEPAKREESFDYKGKLKGSITENKNVFYGTIAKQTISPSQAGWAEGFSESIYNKDGITAGNPVATADHYYMQRMEYDLSHLSPAYLNSLVYKGFHKANGSNAGANSYTYKVQAWDNVGQKYDVLGTGGLMFERYSKALKGDGSFAIPNEPRFDHGGTKNLLPATATKFNWKHTGFSYYDEVVGVPENCSDGKFSVGLKGLTASNLIKNSLLNDLNDKISMNHSVVLNKGYKATIMEDGKFGFVVAKTSSTLMSGKTYLLYVKADTGTVTENLNLALKRADEQGTQEIQIFPLGGIQEVYAKFTFTQNSTGVGLSVYPATNAKAGQWYELLGAMAIELQGEDINLSVEELKRKYKYISSGIKSTVSAVRVKSVGKNLFKVDHTYAKKYEDYNIIDSIAWDAVVTSYYSDRWGIWTVLAGETAHKQVLKCPKFKSNTQYTFTFDFINKLSDGYIIRIFYTDGTSNFVGAWAKNITHHVFTSSPNKTIQYIAFHVSDLILDTLQIEEGTVATSYEPCTESSLYLNAGQPLRSLMNGTKDEVSEGKLIKKVSNVYTLQTTDITSIGQLTNVDIVILSASRLLNYMFKETGDKSGKSLSLEGYSPLGSKTIDSTDSIGCYYINPANWVVIVAKGTTIEQARTLLTGKVLTYQLATPEVLPVESEGRLTAYQNGTLYAEPSLWGYIEAGNSTKTITDITLPAGYIRKVERIDILDGKEVRVDVTADCSLTDLNTAITINTPDLGKRYFYDCSIAEGYSTNGEKTYFFEKAVTLTQGQVVAEWEAVNATKVELVKGTSDSIYYTTVTPDKPKLTHTASMYVKNIGTVPVVIGSQTIQPGTQTRATISIPANTTEAKLSIVATPETVPGTKLALMAWHPQIEEGATATEWVEGRNTGIFIEEGTTNLITDQDLFNIYEGATVTIGEGEGDREGWKKGVVTYVGTEGYIGYLQTYKVQPGKTISVGIDFYSPTGQIYPLLTGSIYADDLQDNGNGRYQLTWTNKESTEKNMGVYIRSTPKETINEVFYYKEYQIEKKAYCTTYTPTTRGEELVTVPARGVLPLEGSLEIEFFYRYDATRNKFLLDCNTGLGNAFMLWFYSENNLNLRLANSNNEGVNVVIQVTTNTRGTVRIAWSKNMLRVYRNGLKIAEKADPYIMQEITNKLYIGKQYNDTIYYLHITSKQWTDEEMSSPDRLPVDGNTTLVKDFSEENLDCITPFEATITSPQKYIDAEGKVNFLVRSSFPADANIPSYVYTDYVQMKASYQQAKLGANAVVLKARNLLDNPSFEEAADGLPVGWGKINNPSLLYVEPKEGKIAITGIGPNDYFYQNLTVIPYNYYWIGIWVKGVNDGEQSIPILIEWQDAKNSFIKYDMAKTTTLMKDYQWVEIIKQAPQNAVKAKLHAGYAGGNFKQTRVIVDGLVFECLGDSPESPTRQGYVEPLRKYLSFSSPVVLAKGEVLSYSNTSQMRVQKNGESVLNQASTEMLLGGFPIQPGKQILEFNCPKDELWKVTLKYQPKYY